MMRQPNIYIAAMALIGPLLQRAIAQAQYAIMKVKGDTSECFGDYSQCFSDLYYFDGIITGRGPVYHKNIGTLMVSVFTQQAVLAHDIVIDGEVIGCSSESDIEPVVQCIQQQIEVAFEQAIESDFQQWLAAPRASRSFAALAYSTPLGDYACDRVGVSFSMQHLPQPVCDALDEKVYDIQQTCIGDAIARSFAPGVKKIIPQDSSAATAWAPYVIAASAVFAVAAVVVASSLYSKHKQQKRTAGLFGAVVGLPNLAMHTAVVPVISDGSAVDHRMSV